MNGESRHPAACLASTLIEVVVALALGVLLLAGVQGIVLGAYRTATVIENQSFADARRQLPFELLRTDLQNQPAGGGLTLRGGVLWLHTMNALQSARVAARHAVGVHYRIEPAADGLCRIVRVEQELGQAFDPETGVVLADNVERAAMEVYDGRRWHSQWPLPTPRSARAVRLAIEWGPGQREECTVVLAPLRWRRHDE